MKKRTALMISATLLLTSCQRKSSTDSDISASSIPLPVVQTTEVPKFSRVVALANGSAEIIASLGYISILVGRDVASTVPDLAAVPVDNPGHSISAELVISQKPDLVILDANSSPQTAITTLKKSGITVVTIADSFDVDSIASKENAIANILQLPLASGKLTAEITKFSSAKSDIKVAFLYLRGTSSIYLIGGKGSGADSLITTMGFRDIGAENLAQPFSAMSAEELVKLNPDVILLMSKGLESVGGLDGLVALPGIAQTRAGKERRVTTVDDSLLLSFGPRTPKLLTLLRANIEKAAA